ncbi:MAG TPA: 3-hydroxyacyl-CoA dehydrogenase NAD-binding domain-containing protein [Myxococcales bacterium]|jgi:3-hydroxyacyl-CoA dehydrogenase
MSYSVQDSVAVITLENPPVNGLSYELRRSIVEGLDRAASDPNVKAIVIAGSGKAFSGGADIKEFNSPKATAEPALTTVIAAVEDSAKPVVAAIHGVAMGGGLELALGCHYRLAEAAAQIALPEVKLGILPGAGGTQRLPRLIGLEAAVNLIVSGASVPAAMLKGTPLFDEVVERDVVPAAVAFARKTEGRTLQRVRDLPNRHANAEGFIAFARNAVTAVSKGYPAPLKALEAIEAGVGKSFAEGARTERDLFVQLVMSNESKALRHAFFAERAASKISGIAEDTKTRPVNSAAVVGAGTMGGGIAMNFANAGIPVSILEVKEDALQRGIATVRKNYEGSAKKGKLTAAQVEERMKLIRPTLDYRDLAQADMVIEAVFEEMSVKEGVFKKLDEVMKPGAILATNTSTLNVDKIAAFTRRPQEVVGTHFFSPANVMKLLEIVRGEKTASDVLSTVMTLSKKIKKIGVVSGVCDGFIGNRMLEKYIRQALALLDEGALPKQVDRALENFGMAMGAFRMADLAGGDVSWFIRKRRYAENPSLPRQVVADRLCEMGRYGQKTGAGWYRYEAGKRDAIPDPAVDELIVAHSKEAGIERRKISDEEIVERCIYALVNEGARILAERIAQSASDIDVVYLAGYGFPPYRGGPMFYADTVGLWNVLRAIERFDRRDPAGAWKPAPLLQQLAAEGKTFNSI